MITGINFYGYHLQIVSIMATLQQYLFIRMWNSILQIHRDRYTISPNRTNIGMSHQFDYRHNLNKSEHYFE